jgi:hypothetical protein
VTTHPRNSEAVWRQSESQRTQRKRENTELDVEFEKEG